MNLRTGVCFGLLLGLTACGGDDAEVEIRDDVANTGAVSEPEPAASPAATGPAQPARAVLRNREGQEVGDAAFTQEGNEVVITLNARNLEGGPHGIHIHAAGQCEAPTFESAGEHFNPTNREHGLQNSNGPHAGDLPNVVVDPDDGLGHDTYRTDRVSLRRGEPNSLLDGAGTSLVIHARPDDNTSQPAGNSGDRVVCGVITAG